MSQTKKNQQSWVPKQIKRDLIMYVEYMRTDFDMNSLEAHHHLGTALFEYLKYMEDQGHIHFFDYVLDPGTGKGMKLFMRIDFKDGGWCKTRLSIDELGVNPAFSNPKVSTFELVDISLIPTEDVVTPDAVIGKYEDAYERAMKVV